MIPLQDFKEVKFETTAVINCNCKCEGVITGKNLKEDNETRLKSLEYAFADHCQTGNFDPVYDMRKLINSIYPIGSVYTSMNLTDPAQLFGGKWIQIVDRFLYCSSNSRVTGGSRTHTHTTGDLALTIKQIPSHSHTFKTPVSSDRSGYPDGSRDTSGGSAANESYWRGNKSLSPSWNGTTDLRGNSEKHNHGNTGISSNMPPYITVYAWYRVE